MQNYLGSLWHHTHIFISTFSQPEYKNAACQLTRYFDLPSETVIQDISSATAFDDVIKSFDDVIKSFDDVADSSSTTQVSSRTEPSATVYSSYPPSSLTPAMNCLRSW